MEFVCLQMHIFLFYITLYGNTDGCSESNATVKLVKGCPKTQKTWEEAAVRKNCGGIPKSCSSFVYHCVMNTWRNETVELCAPRRLIVGKKCPEYNFLGFRIQRNAKTQCNKCPTVYHSDENFKYQECYVVSPADPLKKPIEIVPPLENRRHIPVHVIRPIEHGTHNDQPEGNIKFALDIEKTTIRNQRVDIETSSSNVRIVAIVVGLMSVMAIILIISFMVYRKQREKSRSTYKHEDDKDEESKERL